MKRENRTKNGSLRNTSTDLKGVTCLILKNLAISTVRQKRLSALSKARRKLSRNKLVEKSAKPDS